MGIDLILKYKGKQVADLGRAYHYEVDGEILTDAREITENMEALILHIQDEIIAATAYAPESPDELNIMTMNIRELLSDLQEILLDTGQKLRLADILEDGELTVDKY